ncbi:MAG TPA: hypothetical protein VFP61_07555 [Acidimicrobiales bacterium]|nr:hypothetical protein [Acidimicrobiales bacterium]
MIARPIALWGGIVALILGAWLLHQAYEARGISRPFALKFLPA